MHIIFISGERSHDKRNQILQVKPKIMWIFFTAALILKRKLWSHRKTKPWLKQKWAELQRLAIVLNTISGFRYFSMKTTWVRLSLVSGLPWFTLTYLSDQNCSDQWSLGSFWNFLAMIDRRLNLSNFTITNFNIKYQIKTL